MKVLNQVISQKFHRIKFPTQIQIYKLKMILIFVILVSTSTVHSANILFLFGGGNASHKMSIWPLVAGLADKGHNVTFVSSNEKQPSKHSNVTDITPKPWKDYTAQLYKLNRLQDRIDGKHWVISSRFYEAASLNFCNLTLEATVSDPSFHNIIYNGNFDLVIINSIFGECFFHLAHHLRAKYIVFDSTMFLPWFHGIYGNPMESSWVPHFDETGAHPLGFLDRVKTVIKYFDNYYRLSGFNEEVEALFRTKLDTSIPSLLELERNASLLFINSHHSTDFARSLPPMVVNIGGMQCWNPIGELPQTFQQYMDGAKEGVILISFGSTIDLSSISKPYLDIFFTMMRKYSKVRFIWRWDGDMPEDHPENIMAAKWLPQREILNHHKTIGFMTHCGLNSINEATFHGIPLIAMPLFGDQDLSAIRIQAQEIGVRLEARDLSQTTMDSALGELIYNPKYKRNMVTRSKLFRDRPRSPIDEAVYWTEFVLRNDDTSALKPMLLHQSYWTRASVDVFAVFTALIVLGPILLLVIITKIVKRFN